MLEDPARYGYYREEGGGLMVGLFEPVARRGTSTASPRTSRSARLPPDWDRMAPYLERRCSRVPVAAEAGVRTFFCGPESFTPDLLPVVGEAPELRELLRRAPG